MDRNVTPLLHARHMQMIREGDKTAVVPIGLKEIERRIANSTRIEERKIAVRGVGVTEEAQRIFNGLLVQCVSEARSVFRSCCCACACMTRSRPPPPPATRVQRGVDKRSCSMTRARA